MTLTLISVAGVTYSLENSSHISFRQSQPKVVGTLELDHVSPIPPNQCWKISRFFQQKGKKSPDYQLSIFALFSLLIYMCCSQLCSHCGWLLLKCSAIGIGFNGAETNCRIAHILGILLMNSCNTDRFLATTVVCGLSTLNCKWGEGRTCLVSQLFCPGL